MYDLETIIWLNSREYRDTLTGRDPFPALASQGDPDATLVILNRRAKALADRYAARKAANTPW